MIRACNRWTSIAVPCTELSAVAQEELQRRIASTRRSADAAARQRSSPPAPLDAAPEAGTDGRTDDDGDEDDGEDDDERRLTTRRRPRQTTEDDGLGISCCRGTCTAWYYLVGTVGVEALAAAAGCAPRSIM